MENLNIVGLSQLIETVNGIQNNTLQSYAVLTDKEALLVGHALTQTILMMNDVIDRAPDKGLIESAKAMQNSLIKLNGEVQFQLVANARRKPVKSEA